MTEINKHVYQALETYCNLTVEPEYAVLLKGSWGCGKTHFVEEFMNKHSEFKFLFVSLYGVASVDAIEDKFFQQLNPVLSSKKMVLAGKIGKGLLKGTLRLDLDDDGKPDGAAKIGVPDINIADYLTNTQNCILVFDDLERCSMQLDQILGYINYFVEKDGYKVIVIADEEKLHEKEIVDDTNRSDAHRKSIPLSYASIKEKLIGKTLHLESDIDRVFDILSDKTITNEDLKKEVVENKQLLIDIYKQSEYENLRSLRKIFIEFNSLFSLLNDEVKSNSQLISHLLQIYTVLSMEVYSGNLIPTEICKILGDDGHIAELADDEVEQTESDLKKISDKYILNLDETLINVSDWQSWFNKGVVDRERINQTLMKSLYFQNTNAPEWKRLLKLYDLEQSELDSLKLSIWKSFSNDEIIDIGAIKHVVSTFLYLAREGLISKSIVDVLSESKVILNQLIDNNKIEIPDSFDPEFDFGGYDGFAFISRDTNEFKEFDRFLTDNVISYQAKIREGKLPDLLLLMKTNVDEFRELLCSHNDEKDSFSYKAVLQVIPTEKFIETVEALTNANKQLVCRALRVRYKNQNIPAMKPEFEWIRNVLDQIELKHKNNKTLDSLVMIKFVEWTRTYVNDKP